MRNLEEFDNHHMVIQLNDDTVGLRGFIAVHSIHHGVALGGTRIQAYKSEHLALQDALALSSAMTYKCAHAGLPYGGAKGVIIKNDAVDRDQLLRAYAKMVQELRGLFKTGTDVGITDEDVVKMAQHTGHMLGVSAADRGNLNTSAMAALGVFYATKAALKHANGSEDMRGKKVAIKGLGKLGGELAALAYAEGAEIIGSDVDQAVCRRIKKRLPGIRIVQSNEIHKQQVDVYAPCALGQEFTSQTIQELRCKIVAGGANNQLADNKVGELIFNRGILYVPDYIANAGGLIYVADELEKGGFKKSRVLKRIQFIEDSLATIFERSKKRHVAPHIIADQIAREHVEAWSHDK